MQLGGGLEVGWGMVTADEANHLLQMQAYSWAITRRIPKIEKSKSSCMLAAILSALAAPEPVVAPRRKEAGDVGGSGGDGARDETSNTESNDTNTTTIFVGHDTDVNGIGTLLDIGWKASPYPDNTTAPNVGLRFESVGDHITIDFVYTLLDLDTGVLETSHITNVSMASFCSAASAAIDWGCAPKPTRSICSKFRIVP
jgi:hypothetical protein